MLKKMPTLGRYGRPGACRRAHSRADSRRQLRDLARRADAAAIRTLLPRATADSVGDAHLSRWALVDGFRCSPAPRRMRFAASWMAGRSTWRVSARCSRSRRIAGAAHARELIERTHRARGRSRRRSGAAVFRDRRRLLRAPRVSRWCRRSIARCASRCPIATVRRRRWSAPAHDRDSTASSP